MTFSKLTNRIETAWQSAEHFGGIARKPIDIIVLHHNGGTGTGVVPNCWIQREASAHYQIENGEIIGCLDEDITAWACGVKGYDNNSHTISIEHQNSTGAPNWLVSQQNQEKSAQLVAEIATRRNIPIDRNHILRHREMPGTSTDCSGGLDIDWIVARAKQIVGQGGTPSPKPIPAPTPAPSATPNVFYSMHTKSGIWLPEVKNLADFAGLPNHEHDLVCIRVDKGVLRYRVHTVNGQWLAWVAKGNRADLVNGVAGNVGQAIDGIQIYYTSLTGEKFQAYYRTQTMKRAGWLGVCCDDGTSIKGFDGLAGIIGEPMDRLQIDINNHSRY